MGEILERLRRNQGNAGTGSGTGNGGNIGMKTAEELLADHRAAQGFGTPSGGAGPATPGTPDTPSTGGTGGSGGPAGGGTGGTPAQPGGGMVAEPEVEDDIRRPRPGGIRGRFGAGVNIA